MVRAKLLVVAVAFTALVVGVSGAVAQGPNTKVCENGELATNATYDGLVVRGTCAIAGGGTVTINGNVWVSENAILNDHAASTSVVVINGNVKVAHNGVLGLGTYAPMKSGTTVNGNITADRPASLYLGGMTVNGNVVSNGGGSTNRNFPIKDDTISGNLILHGWTGFWMGAIRDTVGGNLIYTRNAGATDPESGRFLNPDTNEVANNDIAGNLICEHNTPPAQLGDTQQPPSRVAGKTVGECVNIPVHSTDQRN